MNEKNNIYTEYEEVTNETGVVSAPSTQVVEQPTAPKIETTFETSTQQSEAISQSANEVAPSAIEPNTEKGWFSRSKDAIIKGSENFLKRVAAGALESFDKNITSKLMVGPTRQIEKHNAAIAKNDKAIIALNELLMNSPDGYSNEKGQKALHKFMELKAESKAKLETATERLNVRNKWHEGIVNTRNEFIKSIASNYKTIEDAKIEQLKPLDDKLNRCNEERKNIEARNMERDNDITTCINKIGAFRNSMLSAGFLIDDIMKMPAVKEVQKTMEIIKSAKEFDLEELNSREKKLKEQYNKKHYKYEDIAKKRKECEAQIVGQKITEDKIETETKTESEPENNIVTPTINTAEVNEGAPKFSIKDQVQLWNKLGENDPSIILDTMDIAAKMFKQESELMTKEEFSKLATTILESRGTSKLIIGSVSDLLKKAV